MTISFVATATRTATVDTASPFASVTQTMPTGYAVADLLLVAGGLRPFGTDPTIATAGWSGLANITSGTTANGVDGGSVRSKVWYKTAASTSETAPVMDFAASYSPEQFFVYAYRKTNAGSWTVESVTGVDSSIANTTIAVTATGTLALAAGDVMLVAFTLPSDAALAGNPTITVPGCTLGTISQRTATPTTTVGNDGSVFLFEVPIASGTATGAPTLDWTAAATTQSQTAVVFVRLAEPAGEPSLTVKSARAVTRASRPLLTQASPLTVHGARSATRAGRPLLTQITALVVRGARAATRAGRPTLTQQQPLTVHGARTAARADRPLLAQATQLVVRSARAETRAGRALLSQTTALTVRGARALTRAGRPLLTTAGGLTVRGARAQTRAQNVTLAQTSPLTVHGARAETRAQAAVLGQVHDLTVRAVRVATRAAAALLEQQHPLTVRGARVETRAGSPRLTWVVATPAERTLIVPAENRALVAADDRVLTVPAESRTVTV